MADHPYRILLMQGRGLISATIRWQTRCWASHVALHVGGGHVIEAWPPVVRMRRLTDWAGVKAYVHREMRLEDWQEVERRMRSQLGKRYDYGAVLRFLAWQRDSDATNEKWFCFELMHWALRSAGFPIANVADCRVDGGHFEASRELFRTVIPEEI